MNSPWSRSREQKPPVIFLVIGAVPRVKGKTKVIESIVLCLRLWINEGGTAELKPSPLAGGGGFFIFRHWFFNDDVEY